MADQIAPKEGAHQQVADYTTDARSKDSPSDDTDSIKRVFLRVRNESNDLSDFDLANKYLAYASLPLLETKTWTSPHYFHGGNGGYERIYHIILDINYTAAPPDVKIQDIPHELYRVHFRNSRTEPYVIQDLRVVRSILTSTQDF